MGVKAEEMMTPEQKLASDRREKLVEYAEKKTDLTPEQFRDVNLERKEEFYQGFSVNIRTGVIAGQIDGHEIELRKKLQAAEFASGTGPLLISPWDRWEGTMDGKQLTSRETRRLWKKYEPLADLMGSEIFAQAEAEVQGKPRKNIGREWRRAGRERLKGPPAESPVTQEVRYPERNEGEEGA